MRESRLRPTRRTRRLHARHERSPAAWKSRVPAYTAISQPPAFPPGRLHRPVVPGPAFSDRPRPSRPRTHRRCPSCKMACSRLWQRPCRCGSQFRIRGRSPPAAPGPRSGVALPRQGPRRRLCRQDEGLRRGAGRPFLEHCRTLRAQEPRLADPSAWATGL